MEVVAIPRINHKTKRMKMINILRERGTKAEVGAEACPKRLLRKRMIL